MDTSSTRWATGLEEANRLAAELEALKRERTDAIEERQRLDRRCTTITARTSIVENRLGEIFSRLARGTPVVSAFRDNQSTPIRESNGSAQTSSTNGEPASGRNGHTINATNSSRRKTTSTPVIDHGSGDVHQDYPILHPRYGNIVRIKGIVMAIACFVKNCRANCSSHTTAHYFRGVNGLRQHIDKMHQQYKGLELEEVAEQCTKTELTEADVRLVERGETPRTAVVIPVYSTNDTGPLKKVSSQSHLLFDLPQINSKYRHIVKINGAWEELSCGVDECGANYTKHKRVFFQGIRGFLNHLAQVHGVKGIKAGAVLDNCIRRVVSNQDVALMSASPPKEPIDHRIRKIAYEERDLSELPDSASPEIVPAKARGEIEGTEDTVRVSTAPMFAKVAGSKRRSDGISFLFDDFETTGNGDDDYDDGSGPSSWQHRRRFGKAPKPTVESDHEGDSDYVG